MQIPWETLIKMFRKELGTRSLDNLEDYKNKFMDFLNSKVSLISKDSKETHLQQMSIAAYGTVIKQFKEKYKAQQDLGVVFDDTAASNLFDEIVNDYKTREIDKIEKEPLTTTFETFETFYSDMFDADFGKVEIEIRKSHPSLSISPASKDKLKNIILDICSIKHIFERHSGLVFFGYGDLEVYPAVREVLVGCVICDEIRYRLNSQVDLDPGKYYDATIVPYAQSDVTFSVLTGVNPKVNQKIWSSIDESFKELKTELDASHTGLSAGPFTVKGEALKAKIGASKKEITSPIIEMVALMGKENLAELAESLVNITSLISKFTEASESVGGPVDVAIVTKGDGFIWMKRKHYFDPEINKNFFARYM